MLLYGEIHSKPYNNEDYGPTFSVAEVSILGIFTVARCCTLFLSERNVPFPGELHCFTCTCFTVPHVHVVLSHMCMSYCFTCTSKTTLPTGASYVTLREGALSIPEKETDGNDKHHDQKWVYLQLDNWRCTIGISLCLTLLKQAFKRVTSIVHR